MNKGFFFALCIGLCFHAQAQIIFESTSFEKEEAGGIYFDTGDPTTDHPLLNNPGQATVNSTQASADAGDLGFTAFYENTRNSFGLTDGDFIGVTSTDGQFLYPNGNKGYHFSDTDGSLILVFDEINLTGRTTPYANIYYYINPTSYEPEDFARIWIETDTDEEIDLLNTTNTNIDDLNIEGGWILVSADLSGYNSATLKVLFDSNTSNEALFIDFVSFSEGGPATGGNEGAALLQLIHNTHGLDESVDIYLNDTLTFDNIDFRTATPFIGIPAEQPIQLGIAPANSTSVADVFRDTTFNPVPNSILVSMLHGIFSDSTTAEITFFENGQTQTSGGISTIDMLFFNGSPNAPHLAISNENDALFDPTPYGNFSPSYISLPATSLSVKVTQEIDTAEIGTYEGNIDFWSGRTAVLFTSGFIGDQPAFEPWVALSNGETFPLTVPLVASSAIVQLIHNSYTLPNSTVDVYLDGSKIIDDFAFRTATPFVRLPAGVPILVGVAPDSSESAADILFDTLLTLEPNLTYVGVAHGVYGNTTSPVELSFFERGRSVSSAVNNIDLLFFNGIPDAGGLDVISGEELLFNDAFYGGFSADYVSIPPGNLTLNFTPFDNNDNILRAYQDDFGFWKNRTAVIFTTEFLNDTAEFTPWVALSNGGTYPLEYFNDRGEGDGNGIPDFNLLSIFPNPANATTTLYLNMEEEANISVVITDLLGTPLLEENLGILSPGSYETELDLTDVPVGTHFILVQSLDTEQSLPIVVVR